MLMDTLRLKSYYITNPDAPRGRCPTWIFVSAATRAFAGSREIEDGTIGLEDIISLVSSLIDHVSGPTRPLEVAGQQEWIRR